MKIVEIIHTEIKQKLESNLNHVRKYINCFILIIPN